MKLKTILILSSALCLGVTGLSAQEAKQIEQLQQQLRQMQEQFEKQQSLQQREIESLKKKVETLRQEAEQERTKRLMQTPLTPQARPPETAPEELKKLNEKVDAVVEAQKKTRMSEFNPAIGLVGETVFSYRSKGSDKTGSDRPGGFDVFQRSMELNLTASADPFAKAYAVINATADSATGEAALGVEEVALQTTSLPGNLELKAGRFFGEFGRLGYIHDHELPFVNRPLALDQYIGGESRTDGLQLNWLPPLNHYVSVTLGAGDSFGGDSPPNNPSTYRAFNELNLWGRVSTYFDLAPSWQLEAGISGLWNPKTDDRGGLLVRSDGSTLTERERRLAGFDVKLSYVPLQNNQFKSFTWGTEVLYSDNRYLIDPNGSLDPANPVNQIALLDGGGLPVTDALGNPITTTVITGPDAAVHTGNIGALGLYSYVNYKWSRQWSAGVLFDYLQSAQNQTDRTYAYSPFITLALSHWNQLRLQFTHTTHNTVSGLRADDAIFLQWAWIIGAHSHGWQQR